MASLKTVKKREEILKCELGKEINSNKVTKIKCKVCIKHEQNIIRMKGFSKSWINSVRLLLIEGSIIVIFYLVFLMRYVVIINYFGKNFFLIKRSRGGGGG